MEIKDGDPELDKIVDLQRYRVTRIQPKARAEKKNRKFNDSATHVYIDLEGCRLDFGLVKVNEENALLLLEPWFYLGSELIKFYSE